MEIKNAIYTFDEVKEIYSKYRNDSKKFSNLILCGRLADFKYYNMDQALEAAIAKTKQFEV